MKIVISKDEYKWIPYKILFWYVTILIALSIIGPVHFNYDPFFRIVAYIYIGLFLLLTYLGMAKASTYEPYKKRTVKDEHLMTKLIIASVVISLPIKVALVASSIQTQGIPRFTSFFSSLAEVYSQMHEGTESNIFRQIDTFTTFIYYFAIFGGMYWRKRIGKKYRIILIVDMLLDMFYQIAYIGTQRSMITVVILILVLILTNSVTKGYKVDKRKMRKVLLIIVLLFIVFVNVLSARKTLWNGNSLSYVYSRNFDFSNVLLFWCSNDKLKHDVCNLLSYFLQGFYGLSLSFQVPFVWTYGLGSVRGLNSIYSQIIPAIPNMVNDSYPVRAGIAFANDGLANWYTIFPWLASDLTFIGALIYMMIVAWVFMRCWIEATKFDNPLAFTLLVLLSIQYVFIIANNSLFISRGETLATIVLLLLYVFFHKRFNSVEE